MICFPCIVIHYFIFIWRGTYIMHKTETNMFTVTCGIFVLMCTKRVLLQIFKDTKVKRKKIGFLLLYRAF